MNAMFVAAPHILQGYTAEGWLRATAKQVTEDQWEVSLYEYSFDAAHHPACRHPGAVYAATCRSAHGMRMHLLRALACAGVKEI